MTEIFSNPLQTKTMLNRLMDCGSSPQWHGGWVLMLKRHSCPLSLIVFII